MSANFKLKVEGTGIEHGSGMLGNEYSLYHCAKSLPAVSVDRILGTVRDTTDPGLLSERYTFSANREAIHRDLPAMRIINEEQGGLSLTFHKWRGIVKEIGEETFIARTSELFNNVPEEEIEFFRADIQDDDKELLSVGAEFYWCIGYIISSSGQQRRASFLRFRRLPLFTNEGIKIASEKIRDIQENITWL